MLYAIFFFCVAQEPLPRAHSHNDYAQDRPLFSALEQGFCSVEADIFLQIDGKLLVGHTQAELKPDRTLQKLYLDPLQQRVKANKGNVYGKEDRFWLLIDIKTEGEQTYSQLHQVLEGYSEILTEVSGEKVTHRAVTVVISGNRPKPATLQKQTKRYAGLDGRLTDVNSELPAHLMPWISDRWYSHFKWTGEGTMPESEKQKLREIVEKANQKGRMLRFWGTPEKESLWKELERARVDLIGTDNLVRLKREFSMKN